MERPQNNIGEKKFIVISLLIIFAYVSSIIVISFFDESKKDNQNIDEISILNNTKSVKIKMSIAKLPPFGDHLSQFNYIAKLYFDVVVPDKQWISVEESLNEFEVIEVPKTSNVKPENGSKVCCELIIQRVSLPLLPHFKLHNCEIHVLKLQNCGLLIIEKEHLENYGRAFLDIDLSYNNLEYLRSNLLESFENLTMVNFAYNELLYISADMLLKFSTLTLNFEGNRCIDTNTKGFIVFNKSENASTNLLVDALDKCSSLDKVDKITDFEKLKSVIKSNSIKLEMSCQNVEIGHSTLAMRDSSEKGILLKCGNFTADYPNTEISISRPTLGLLSEINLSVSLVIQNSTMKFLPKNLNASFLNVFNFTASNISLLVITRQDLSQFGKSLNYLDLSHNHLKSIEDDLFNDNQNLMQVDLSYNNFMKMYHLMDNLKQLPNLKTVFFRDCNCINGTYVKKIKKRNISSYDIKQLDYNNCASGTKSSMECKISNNKLILDAFAKQITNDTAKESDNALVNQIISYSWILVLVLVLSLLTTLTTVYCKLKKLRRENKIFKSFDAHWQNSKNMDELSFEIYTDIKKQVENLPYKIQYEFKLENLKIVKELGSGEFGWVLQGSAKNIVLNEKETNVAVKQAKKSIEAVKALTDEIKIMICLQEKTQKRHLNVVNLLGAITKHVRKGECYAIVEYCSLGNLKTFLIRNRSGFKNELTHEQNDQNDAQLAENDLLTLPVEGYLTIPKNEEFCCHCFSASDLVCWAYQIACGMTYLSENGIIHRDLAARNILMTLIKGKTVIKICDFGLAKNMENKSEYRFQKYKRLPFRLMAPESLSEHMFGTHSDVWSYGVLLWEMFSIGSDPYESENLKDPTQIYQFLKKGNRLLKPKFANNEIYYIMESCWHYDWKARKTFDELQKVLGVIHSSMVMHFSCNIGQVKIEELNIVEP